MKYSQKPIINGLYRHYKGGTYKVFTLAKHTETKEDLVICQSIEYGSFDARPLSEWFDSVTDHLGQTSTRFVYKH